MGRWSGKSCRLSTMMIMTASFFLVEIIVGYITNSIALVADSFHMLSDVVALIVGFASVRISKWKTKRNTYGWQRAEVLGALVNSVFLLALCFSILVESLKRLVEVEEVDNPILLLVVGIVGLLVNIFGLFLFGEHGHSHGGGGHGHGHSHGSGHNHGHSHDTGGEGHHHDDNGHDQETTRLQINGNENVHNNVSSNTTYTSIKSATSSDSTLEDDREVYALNDNSQTAVVKHHSSAKSLNMRGVFLHVLGDALGSGVVIISALVILFVHEDWKYYLDPSMSILMVIIILTTTIPLFKETAYILLQTVPRHVDVEAIIRELKEIDGIAGVHECHIWQLAGRRIIASAHIHCKDIIEYMTLANKIKDVFHKAGIHSTTIQPEFLEHPDDQKSCLLVCGNEGGDKCEEDTCCGPRKMMKGSERPEGSNNSNSNDVIKLLPSSGQHQPTGASWHVDMKMSPEGDEVVLDLSKTD